MDRHAAQGVISPTMPHPVHSVGSASADRLFSSAPAGDDRITGPLKRTLREHHGAFDFGLGTPADDPDVRRLLRDNPMGDAISISLEREPDTSLAATVEGDVHHTIIVRDRTTGALAAVGAVSVRDTYINGRPRRLGYLGQLRLDRAYAGRASVLRGGYAFFRTLHQSLGVELYLTSILADNRRARRFLERGLPGMPTYRPVETFETLVMPVGSFPLLPLPVRRERAGERVLEDCQSSIADRQMEMQMHLLPCPLPDYRERE
jgi:hypothetical protein